MQTEICTHFAFTNTLNTQFLIHFVFTCKRVLKYFFWKHILHKYYRYNACHVSACDTLVPLVSSGNVKLKCHAGIVLEAGIVKPGRSRPFCKHVHSCWRKQDEVWETVLCRVMLSQYASRLMWYRQTSRLLPRKDHITEQPKVPSSVQIPNIQSWDDKGPLKQFDVVRWGWIWRH